MISDELKSIIEQLKTQGRMSFSDGASEEQIVTFEQENDMKLPSKYREWLIFSDGGEFFLPGGVQMYGVAHKPLIDTKNNDKPNENYIVIGSLASGDPILCEKTGERISIYNQGAGRIEEDETYPDFFSFLNHLYDLLGIGE